MPACILCLSKIKRFVFMKRIDKSRESLSVCKTCKRSDPITSNLLSAHTEEQIIDLLKSADIVKVFKCMTRIKKQKYKNFDHYKLLLKSLLKIDFTQILIDNIHDTALIALILSYSTKIQWRKICTAFGTSTFGGAAKGGTDFRWVFSTTGESDTSRGCDNYTVLEYTLLNITDLEVIDLLKKKILNITNTSGAICEAGSSFGTGTFGATFGGADEVDEPIFLEDKSYPSTKPPPYSSLKLRESFSTPSPAPSAPSDIQSYGFAGKWVLLYNNN